MVLVQHKACAGGEARGNGVEVGAIGAAPVERADIASRPQQVHPVGHVRAGLHRHRAAQRQPLGEHGVQDGYESAVDAGVHGRRH